MKSVANPKRLLLIALASGMLTSCQSQAPRTMPPAGVGVQTLQNTMVSDQSDYVATLISRHSVILQPQIAGNVTNILVKAGDHVKQGQLLMLVDPDPQAAAVQSQGATVKQAEATLNTLQQQREGLTSALNTSQQQYNRYATLYAEQSASKSDLEKYTDAFKQAQANLDANQAQIQAQRADIVTEQKKYDEATADLEHNRITAPFDGVIGDVPVKLGTYVQPLTQIISVTDNDPLEVNISVPSEETQKLKPSLPVQLLDDDGKILGQASIFFISPRVDQNSQTILIKAILRNPAGLFKADQVVNGRIIWQELPGLKIPTESVTHLGGRDFVYIVAQDPKGTIARQVPVSLGRIEGPDYIVLSGLKAGDQLIVSGIQKLTDGAPIKPQSQSAQSQSM